MNVYQIANKPHLKLRIFATIIDYIIYLFLFIIYIVFVGKETETSHWEVTGLTALPIYLFWLLYFPGTEALNQATPGHDILKLKVIKTDGSKITFYDAFKRRVCDPLDIGLYGLPAIICIKKTDKHQRIGDILADTIVVKKEDVTETEFSIRHHD